jgi:hypothetical protein
LRIDFWLGCPLPIFDPRSISRALEKTQGNKKIAGEEIRTLDPLITNELLYP